MEKRKRKENAGNKKQKENTNEEEDKETQARSSHPLQRKEDRKKEGREMKDGENKNNTRN